MEEFLADNVRMAVNSIQAAYENGVKRFLFLGGTCIYPRMSPQPIHEKSRLSSELEHTNEAYALTKITGLKLCQYYRRQASALIHLLNLENAPDWVNVGTPGCDFVFNFDDLTLTLLYSQKSRQDRSMALIAAVDQNHSKTMNSDKLKILLHTLYYSPDELGVAKYSGEMVSDLVSQGCQVTVVTTPPFYPQWKIAPGFSGFAYSRQIPNPPAVDLDSNSEQLNAPTTPGKIESVAVEVIRCPLWVPRHVTALKRVVHFASFGLSSVPIVLWKAITQRPDVIVTVEPAAFCMPTTLIAARLCGAKAWLHVQDFEVDAAFALGILRQPLIRKCVLAVEAFFMRRFDRVSSISPKMVEKLTEKGVANDAIRLFPNWVDCDVMRPLENAKSFRAKFGLPDGKCIAIYSGNIGAKQGLEIVVDAAKLCSNRSDIHFVICGHGVAFQAIEESTRGLANLQMLPVQPMEVFNELMNAADIHLLPQRGDAADLVMPSKLTGMLATGRPVVTCASEGTQIAQVVEGRGLVVQPGDTQGFCDAIVKLAEDAGLREQMGASAREYAVYHLGKRAILDRFMHDLSGVCRRGGWKMDGRGELTSSLTPGERAEKASG